MSRKAPHIVPRDGQWAVKRENASRASSLHETQQEAIDAGRRLAQADRTELYIHGRDGRIRDANSYGNDPFPPKG